MQTKDKYLGTFSLPTFRIFSFLILFGHISCKKKKKKERKIRICKATNRWDYGFLAAGVFVCDWSSHCTLINVMTNDHYYTIIYHIFSLDHVYIYSTCKSLTGYQKPGL